MSKDIYIPKAYGEYALLSCVWAQIHIWMLFYSFDVFDVQAHLAHPPPSLAKKMVQTSTNHKQFSVAELLTHFENLRQLQLHLMVMVNPNWAQVV